MQPHIQIHVLPGGIEPKRQSEGAVGYDAAIRAVVCPEEMDPHNAHLRKTLFDFQEKPQGDSHVEQLGDELVYRMDPLESVLVGIGFITVMPSDVFYWIAPRSGLAAKYGITVTNAPGTVDSDYRGEAGVLVYNRNDKPFDLKKGMRIAQIIFQRALFPQFETVSAYEDLSETVRGAGGFGSTGLLSDT